MLDNARIMMIYVRDNYQLSMRAAALYTACNL